MNIAVNTTAMASLLADCETKCTSGCDNGTIDNRAVRDAWWAEHGEKMALLREERRVGPHTWSSILGAEESALKAAEPRPFLACDCNGTGFVLTADGRALIEFLDRHRPMDHDHLHSHSEGWA